MDYIDILLITFPTCLLAIIVTSFINNRLGKELKDDPVYQQRLSSGMVKMRGESKIEILPYARRSLIIFLCAIALVVMYATAISPRVGLIPSSAIVLSRDNAILTIMLSAATAIAIFCKADTTKVINTSTFKSGMSAVVCILGVAWLGTSFVGAYTAEINALAGDLLNVFPWLLAVALFFSATLLYSQAATTRALMPLAISLGVAPLTIVASFAAVCALYVLPTYPVLLAAVEMDDTGSTRIGKYVFNHPFLIPGFLVIAFSVIFAFMWGAVII